MRRLLLGAAMAAILLGLAGCTGGKPAASNSSAQPTAPTREGPFRVALLTPGPVSDSGWSALAYEGLKAIESEFGAEISQQEASGPGIPDALRTYAQQNYNLVIGHGFEYNAPAVTIARDFPRTVFVSSSGGESTPNAGAFRFYLEQGFYLAGTMAGLMSKNNAVAMIGGPDVPSIRSTFKAFRAGAEAAKPGIRVIELFTGQEADIAAAKQATLRAIDQGADFVIHQANAAAQGVFEACKERGVKAFGANADQNGNPTGVVVASAVIVARPVFVELARQVKAGEYKGGIQLVGMKEGAIDFILNPALAASVPQEVRAKLDQVRANVLSDKLTVPKDEF